jgi:hypothetical protein
MNRYRTIITDYRGLYRRRAEHPSWSKDMRPSAGILRACAIGAAVWLAVALFAAPGVALGHALQLTACALASNALAQRHQRQVEHGDAVRLGRLHDRVGGIHWPVRDVKLVDGQAPPTA